jgi:hypothetical protein
VKGAKSKKACEVSAEGKDRDAEVANQPDEELLSAVEAEAPKEEQPKEEIEVEVDVTGDCRFKSRPMESSRIKPAISGYVNFNFDFFFRLFFFRCLSLYCTQ